jgi:hypothetical protein
LNFSNNIVFVLQLFCLSALYLLVEIHCSSCLVLRRCGSGLEKVQLYSSCFGYTWMKGFFLGGVVVVVWGVDLDVHLKSTGD